MKNNYNYIQNEYKRFWLSPILNNEIEEIILLVIQLNPKDYMDIYLNLKTDLSIKIIMKYILDDKEWNIFFKIFSKKMGLF